MNKKTCKDCRFWKHDDFIDSIAVGWCNSMDIREAFGPRQQPPSFFGCVFWQQREPALREQLAEYIDGMVSHYIPSGRWEWKKERGPRVADEIIAMFEKHQS